jgi:hypothetical protein
MNILKGRQNILPTFDFGKSKSSGFDFRITLLRQVEIILEIAKEFFESGIHLGW